MTEHAGKAYRSIVEFCEGKLRDHGDSYLGVGWTKRQEDADARYQVMLDLVDSPSAGQSQTLLDFGCGASHLLDYIRRRGVTGLGYAGLDVSEEFIKLSRAKNPGTVYHHLDVLERPDALPEYDWIVMNGVFTAKISLTFDEMWGYFERLVRLVHTKARRGIAFNVMSKQVEWERDDLFHVPMDKLVSFVARDLSRHFLLRHDYGLYEYTAYVFKAPRRPDTP